MAATESPATARLEQLFAEVLEHAEQDPARFLLIPVPGAPRPNGRKAAFYKPGFVNEDPDDILGPQQLDAANAADARNLLRVAAFTDIDWSDPLEEAILAGLLRHEVRHAEQFDALGHQFFDLYEIALLVGSWKVAGMPRGGILYGLIPAEMDANAAAAKFLRERRPQKTGEREAACRAGSATVLKFFGWQGRSLPETT